MAEDDSAQAEPRRIGERLEQVERALCEQDARLRAVEARLGLGPAPVNQQTEYAHAEAVRRRDVEALVGGSWFNWLGIIAVTFGVAFFLKYAFDNKWVTRGVLIALGTLAGLSVLALAELLRERGFRAYAYVLSGGGILILYLSAYAAYGFYGERVLAFALMSLVTAGAVALSVRQDAPPVALLALVGGFLTPPLLATGGDNQTALFTYVALLDAGVVALAYFKRWRWLNTMSLFGTILTVLAWMSVNYRRAVGERFAATLLFLTLFFLLYAAIAIVRNVLRRRPARWTDALLVTSNAAFYLAMGYAVIGGAGHKSWRGPFALAVAALFAALVFAARARARGLAPLAFAYAAASVGALAVAAATEFEREWVTVSWVVMGAALLTWGYKRRSRPARVLGLGLLGLTTFKVFLYDLASLDRLYRIISFVVLGAILLAVSYFYQKRQREPDAKPSV